MRWRAAVGCELLVDRPELAHESLKSCRVLLRHAAARKGGPIDVFDLADFQAYRRSLPARQLDLAVKVLDSLRRLAAHDFDRLAADLRLDLWNLQVVVLPKSSPANLACPPPRCPDGRRAQVRCG